MQLDEQQIKKIYDYFEKIAYARCSDWVVEMRRQIAIKMMSEGIKPGRTAKVLHVSHCLMSFYRDRMVPRPDVTEVVTENLWKWIDEGLYPMPGNTGRLLSYTYRLTDDPNKRKPKYVAKNKKNALDMFIDSL